MRYYPVSLDISKKDCLVVGGGAVGTRKVKMLLKCGADVTVVSPEINEALNAIKTDKRLHLEKREYRDSDCKGKFLIISATDDPGLNLKIAAKADSMKIMCNIADRPELSAFVLPSVINRGDLTITVSTSGKSPAFSKKLRNDLEKQFGEEYALFLSLMGVIRKRLLVENHDPERHRIQFRELIGKGLFECIKDRDYTGVDSLLKEVLGSGYSYNDLMKD